MSSGQQKASPAAMRCCAGRITVEQFVAVTATNPAKLFGLYPRKGTIAVGSDADLVVWDDTETRTIDGAAMYSRADYSPYDGFEVSGWPKWTLSRGEVVLAEVMAPLRNAVRLDDSDQ